MKIYFMDTDTGTSTGTGILYIHYILYHSFFIWFATAEMIDITEINKKKNKKIPTIN